MIDLTVSIVNTDHCEMLEELLDSIVAHTREISYEIYVVDNASSDGSADMVRRRFPDVHLICSEERSGFSKNHNRVLEQGEGRYLILLNEDMVLLNDALDRMVAFMDTRPICGACGCKLLNVDGSVQRSCWVGFPSPKTLFIDMFYLSVILPKSEWVRQVDASLRGTVHPIEVDHVLGACLLIRREVMECIGMLDETFPIFLEETDWCYRIKQTGQEVYWVPEGEILHHGQQSVSRDPRRFIPLLYRNHIRFCRKHGGTKAMIMAMKTVILLGVAYRGLLWTGRFLSGRLNAKSMVQGYLRTLLTVPSF